MIFVNMRRMTECSQCERPVPVTDNKKLHDDERDQAELCKHCEQTLRAEAKVMCRREEP